MLEISKLCLITIVFYEDDINLLVEKSADIISVERGIINLMEWTEANRLIIKIYKTKGSLSSTAFQTRP
jgi:hypothetical protein